MAGLDRAIRLIHLLCDRPDGLTLDEMAAELDVGRRTAERWRAAGTGGAPFYMGRRYQDRGTGGTACRDA